MTDLDALVEWTAEAASHLSGPEAEVRPARIEDRYPALHRALEDCWLGGSDAGLTIAIHLTQFWIRRFRCGRGRYFLERMLPVTGYRSMLRVRALEALALLHESDDRLPEMREALRAAVETLGELSVESVSESGAVELRGEPERGSMPMTDIGELAAWTAEAGALVAGPDSAVWLARIEARLPNIFSTLGRYETKAPEQREACLRVITNLERFWILSTRTMRGLGWLRRFLRDHPQVSAPRADALLCQARIQLAESLFADAMASSLEADQICRDLGNAAGVASAFDLYRAAEARTKFITTREGGKTPPLLDLAALTEWTAEAASHLTGPDQAEWLARIDERLPEITFTLRPGFPQWNGHRGAALRIAVNLGRYWWVRGRGGMGKKILKDLLTSADEVTPLQADGLLALAGLEYAVSSYAAVQRTCLQAGAIYRSLRDEAGVAASLNQLGMAERETGEFATSRAHHEEARALYLALGDERGAVSCLSNLGVVALFEGSLSAAEELHESARAERERLGDLRGIASSLGSLGTIARLREDLERARELHEEALTIRRDLGDPWGVAGSLVNLALVAIRSGDLPTAGDLLGEATAGFTRVGDRLGVCETLDARALLTFAEDCPAEAVRLFSVARTAREGIGAPLPPVYRKEIEPLLEACKARLGAEAFDAAWKAGQLSQYSPFPLTPSEVP